MASRRYGCHECVCTAASFILLSSSCIFLKARFSSRRRSLVYRWRVWHLTRHKVSEIQQPSSLSSSVAAAAPLAAASALTYRYRSQLHCQWLYMVSGYNPQETLPPPWDYLLKNLQVGRLGSRPRLFRVRSTGWCYFFQIFALLMLLQSGSRDFFLSLALA